MTKTTRNYRTVNSHRTNNNETFIRDSKPGLKVKTSVRGGMIFKLGIKGA
jgi:hypothetical protein